MPRRREVPTARVSQLWKMGLNTQQIAIALGRVDGQRFTRHAIESVIWRERRYGDADLFPMRSPGPSRWHDEGIPEWMQRALGL